MLSAQQRRRLVALSGAASLLLVTSTTQADEKDVHSELTNRAWQIMRAASHGTLVSSVNWHGTAPTTPALIDPGPCAAGQGLCGETVSSAEWRMYRAVLYACRGQCRVPQAVRALPSRSANRLSLA
jgi:hypothetical protein